MSLPQAADPPITSSLPARLWTYQAERFPVFAHGPLIAAFSFSAVGYSWLLRGGDGFPVAAGCAVAFVVCLLFFLQLRIADEFKDFEEDAQYRPYRPVPRGLVSLRLLGAVGVVIGLVQIAAAAVLSPRLLPVLAGVWVYFALMSREFFAREFLKARPITYMVTHMMIMPLVDFFATACDWVPATGLPPAGLWAFLATSLFNGFVIEIGRKLRSPEDEEPGVNTYTVLWGRNRAVGAWLAMLAVTAAAAIAAAERIDFVLPVAAALGVGLLVALAAAVAFLRRPTSAGGKRFELLSGLWTLVLYLSLGAVPVLAHIFRRTP